MKFYCYISKLTSQFPACKIHIHYFTFFFMCCSFMSLQKCDLMDSFTGVNRCSSHCGKGICLLATILKIQGNKIIQCPSSPNKVSWAASKTFDPSHFEIKWNIFLFQASLSKQLSVCHWKQTKLYLKPRSCMGDFSPRCKDIQNLLRLLEKSCLLGFFFFFYGAENYMISRHKSDCMSW